MTSITQHLFAKFRHYFIPFRVRQRSTILCCLSCWHDKRPSLAYSAKQNSMKSWKLSGKKRVWVFVTPSWSEFYGVWVFDSPSGSGVFLLFLNFLVYINNSLHLARKYARIFVRGHYLFREANCELRGTDNVQGQISEHIFAAKLRLLCLLSIGFKNWGISSDSLQF